MAQKLDQDYWQQRYRENNTGWDAGAVTTPLKTYFDQFSDHSLRILVPGCGNAYEAEYLFQNGFRNVFIADIAKEPLENFQERVPSFPPEQLLHQDFFTITQTFDRIIEQTFFCALPPEKRPDYARKCYELLNPGGRLAGVLFDAPMNQHEPPFGGSRDEYRRYFEPYFDFIHFESCYNSIPPRQGKELFICLQKKNSAEPEAQKA